MLVITTVVALVQCKILHLRQRVVLVVVEQVILLLAVTLQEIQAVLEETVVAAEAVRLMLEIQALAVTA